MSQAVNENEQKPKGEARPEPETKVLADVPGLENEAEEIIDQEAEPKKSFFQRLISGSFFQLWKNRHKIGEKKISKNLQQFLPPSLEVLETPPHPAPRILLAVTVAIVLVGAIWATVGKIDIITVAEGKIIPGGKVKQIQPYERGVVTKIWVAEGQMVEAGQPLVELDQTQTGADETRLLEELDFLERSCTRREILAKLLQPANDQPSTEGAKDGERVSALTFEEIKNLPELKGDSGEIALLYEEWRSLTSQLETLESQLKERQKERQTAQEMINQYTNTLPLIEQRLGVIEGLYNKGYSTLNEYLSLKEEMLRQSHTLAAEKARFEQLTASIETVNKQIAAQKSQSLSQVLTELEDFKRQRKSMRQEVAKAKDLSAKQLLASPVKGTIKGLEVNTIGGVVTPAQVLMEIVPIGEKLEVEAFVSNQDIGYVKEGQSAEVKINTFPFTKYGIIDATVESVARDATVDEKLGLIYRTRLVLKKNTIMVDGKETQLMPGMAVSAEIATGQRRLIEFFLAPLLRMKQESLRER